MMFTFQGLQRLVPLLITITVVDEDPLPTDTVPAYATDQCTSNGKHSYTFTATGTGVAPIKIQHLERIPEAAAYFTVSAREPIYRDRYVTPTGVP